MQIRSIAAAAAALVACGAAQALTIEDVVASRANGTLKEIYIAGASAQRLFIGAWFQSRCKATGATNTFDVFYSGNAGASNFGTDHRGYSCELKANTGAYTAGTKMLLVKRDLGGSSQGVNPIATDTAGPSGNTNQSQQSFMVVDSTCVRTANARPTLDIQSPTYACPTVANRLADAGVSDLEPALFQRPVNLAAPATPLTTPQINNLNVGTINQTIFGVAVNLKAYRALQETQGLPTNDNDLNRPSLPRAWVAGALRGDILGDGGVANPLRRGWGLVIDSAVDPQVEVKAVNVCRRGIGSGTQASFNVYFQNAGCATPPTNVNLIPGGQTTTTVNSTATGFTSPTSVAVTGTNRFILNSSAGNVETCLTNTENLVDGDAYAIGVLSRENTATPTGANPPVDRGYRFVKLDGDAPLRDLAKVGDYDFIFNATMQWNKTVQTDADKISFLSNMRANAGKATSLNVADVDTQQGVLAPPSTYTGPYANLTDPTTLKFASRVDRGANQSCSSLRIVR
jgi:hypothetical protein